MLAHSAGNFAGFMVSERSGIKRQAPEPRIPNPEPFLSGFPLQDLSGIPDFSPRRAAAKLILDDGMTPFAISRHEGVTIGRNSLRKRAENGDRDMLIHSAPAEADRASWRDGFQTVHSEPVRGLAGQIRRAFRAAGYPALRRIDVTLDYCGVLLRGTVPSYFVKQVAQELAMRAAGKDPVWNELEVEKEGQ